MHCGRLRCFEGRVPIGKVGGLSWGRLLVVAFVLGGEGGSGYTVGPFT